jgi:hypothetical protein
MIKIKIHLKIRQMPKNKALVHKISQLNCFNIKTYPKIYRRKVQRYR